MFGDMVITTSGNIGLIEWEDTRRVMLLCGESPRECREYKKFSETTVNILAKNPVLKNETYILF